MTMTITIIVIISSLAQDDPTLARNGPELPQGGQDIFKRPLRWSKMLPKLAPIWLQMTTGGHQDGPSNPPARPQTPPPEMVIGIVVSLMC